MVYHGFYCAGCSYTFVVFVFGSESDRNYRQARPFPASSVSHHHSAQIGDITAFMAVGCPGARCLDIFLPQKGSQCPRSSMGKGRPNVSSGTDSDLGPSITFHFGGQLSLNL